MTPSLLLPPPDPALASLLARDRSEQLDRLAADGHGDEALAAFAALDSLLAGRGLHDHGRLGLVASRNHARRVVDAGGRELVLKLTMAPFGDELTALRAWQRPALVRSGAVPALVAGGRLRTGALWSLQTRLPGTTCWVNERPELTERGIPLLLDLRDAAARAPAMLARAQQRLPHGTGLLLDEAHAALDLIVDARALAPRTVALLRTAAARAGAALAALDPADDVVLHADFACNNLVVDDDHVGDGHPALGVIDPAGRCGPVELDAARWVARSLSAGPLGDGLTRVLAAAEGRLAVAPLAAGLVLQGILLVHWTTYEDHVTRPTAALVDDVRWLDRLV
jgi:hypothetical protein